MEILEAEVKRLEGEYNMFFAGRLPRPPWETRSRVNALMKDYFSGAARRSLEPWLVLSTELWLRARSGGP